MNKEEKMIGIECADIYLRFPEIMKEEFDDLLEFLEDEHIRYEGATDVFMNLQNKVKKQKEVIDKVYELIKQHIRKDGFLELNEWQTRDLLDILKGVSK